jgi:hypothetical protein
MRFGFFYLGVLDPSRFFAYLIQKSDATKKELKDKELEELKNAA